LGKVGRVVLRGRFCLGNRLGEAWEESSKKGRGGEGLAEGFLMGRDLLAVKRAARRRGSGEGDIQVGGRAVLSNNECPRTKPWGRDLRRARSIRIGPLVAVEGGNGNE